MHVSMQQRCTLRIDVQGIPTIPSTLQEELDTNPFLRPDDPAIRKNLSKLHAKCHQRSDRTCYVKLLFGFSGCPVADAITYNNLTVTTMYVMASCAIMFCCNSA